MGGIPLEDGFTDVVGKALRGLKLGPAELCAQAGISSGQLSALLGGEADEAVLRAIAKPLGLGAKALVALAQGAYLPQVAAPEGLAGFNTPHEDYFVNAYLVWDVASKQAIAFDTGTQVEGMLACLAEHGLSLKAIFLTHTHADHILELPRLQAATGAPAHLSELEQTPGAQPIVPGQRFAFGPLQVEARRTSGHTRGGMSYHVTGLPQGLVAVGDALFAGSQGGGLVSHLEALETNRAALFSLPPETLVLPGHGPLTTIGLEAQHNPFYPEFQEP